MSGAMATGWIMAAGVAAIMANVGVTLGPHPQRAMPVAIDRGVYVPYSKRHYPTFWADWGKNGMARIERARAGAAKLTSFDTRCDKVELAELAQRRSLPPTVIVIFVDCTNRFRRYVGEDEALAALR